MKRLTLDTVRPSVSDVLLALALLALVLLLADASYAQSDSPYGYVRTLEGEATLVPADDEEAPFTTSINQPVLPGDRLYVEPGARLEVVLPEGTRVRAGDGAELDFAVLGVEEDGEGPRMQLLNGELQLTVPDVTASSATPRIDTHNATVYAVDPGQFAVRVRGTQNTLVTVRSGTVEVRTPRGASILRADEALNIDGGDWPEVALVETPAWTSLEVWGYDLDQQIADARVPEELADDRLAYDAAPLDRHGDWVDVEGQYAWRPTVDYDWRPYTAGRWYYTPAGLSWVSPEPWGWMTYHYGSWDWVSHHGWVWFPARRWAPAWVYWYWGPDYVGWVPVGVYARHYGRRHHYGHFRWGSYGWAGGSWGHYKHWTFVSHGRLHERNLARHAHRRASVTRPGGRTAVPRGLITTDTSGLSRAAWQRPGEAAEVLSRRAVATRPGARAELPDVTSFVARSADLSPEVERRVVARGSEGRTITPPSAGRRQALRRIGSGAPERSAAPGRAVVRVPRGEGRPGGDTTDAAGRSVRGRDGEASHGTETWRRSPDAPSAGARTPSARSVRTRSRSTPASPPSRSTDRNREVRGAPSDGSARARPPATRDPDRSDTRVRAIPDSRSDWRGGSSTRSVVPRGDAGDRTPDSSPPVRRVIDAVRGAPAAPPVRRAAPPTTSRPPTSRAAPPRATTPTRSAPRATTPTRSSPRATAPTRSAPRASPGRGTTRRPDVRSSPPSRSSSGVSSRSPSRRASPSSPSRSGSSSSRGVSSRSSRSSGSSRASSPPPRRESSSRGGESRGRAKASRRSPD